MNLSSIYNSIIAQENFNAKETGIIGIIKSLDDLSTFRPASENDIVAAEKALKLKFHPDYRLMVKTFGYVSFASHELSEVGKGYNNVVDMTLDYWKWYKFVPHTYYVLENHRIDDHITWQDSSTGAIYHTSRWSDKVEKIFDALGDYLQDCNSEK